MIYHFLAACGLILLLLRQPLWTAWFVGFVFGWLREQSYEYGQAKQRHLLKDHYRYPTFLDAWWHWQTSHKLWEAAHWGIGGEIGALIWAFAL